MVERRKHNSEKSRSRGYSIRIPTRRKRIIGKSVHRDACQDHRWNLEERRTVFCMQLNALLLTTENAFPVKIHVEK